MEKIDIHFFHGFLGLPIDWKPVSEELSFKNYNFHFHNLWEDIKKISEVRFDTWVNYKKREINTSNINIGIGYSLGGRLLLHLPETAFHKIFLISTHPGLKKKEEKDERLQSDKRWAEKFENLEWDELMKLWENQEVFKSDRNRPERKENNYQRKDLSLSIEGFSLGLQEPMDDKFSQFKEKVFWIYGADDKKFAHLSQRWQEILGKENVFKVGNSGHSCLFDQPEELSDIIKSVMAES